MTKIHKKKANIFGKKVPVLLLALIFVAGIGSAALLGYFGQITGSATVEQGLLVDGESMDDSEDLETTWDGSEFTSLEAKTFVSAHDLTNNADSDAEVTLGQHEDDGCSGAGSCDEIDTSYWSLETLEDSNDEEQTWGDGLKELDDELEVSVSYEDDKAVFKAEGPSDYDYSQDMMTFAFDTNTEDDEANFQVQYNTNEDESWQISYVEDGSWSDWKDVPEEFVTDKDEDEFTLKLPISELGGVDSSYKFGVDADGQNSDNGQTFYSADPEKLWHNGETFTSSDNYVSMDVGTEITDTEEVPSEESVDFAIVTDFPQMTYPGTYDITTTVDMAE